VLISLFPLNVKADFGVVAHSQARIALPFSCDDAAVVGIDHGHERFSAAHVCVFHDFFQLPEGLTRQQKIKASHLVLRCTGL
jgi:hypothetical protein